MPLVLHTGSIGLFKLELRELTLTIDRVDIVLRFKTVEEYKEYRRCYKNIQITAEKIERLKEACLKDLSSTTNFNSSRSTRDADLSSDILKQLLSKLKLRITNVSVRLEAPAHAITLLLSSCKIYVRRINLNDSQKE